MQMVQDGICSITLGTIANCINNVNITTTGGSTGGICLRTEKNAYINNCVNKGSISGVGYLGGIVGQNNGKVQNCTSNSQIQGEYLIGGIVGYNSGRIENCMFNEQQICGKYLVGGIAGINEPSSSVITDCCNLGNVTSTGAVTWETDGSTGTPQEALTGGITGHNYGTVTRSINQGTVKASHKVVGGISGRNLRDSVILL